jgi:hypothetical protein
MGPLMARGDVTRRLFVLVLLAGALALCGCEEENSKPVSTPTPKTNQFESGRFALQKMIPAARMWAPDALPVNLSSSGSSGGDGRDGKSMFWRAVFASRSRAKSEAFMWTGEAGAKQRVDHGVEDPFNPNNRTSQPWDINFLKADTDQAFAAAQEHGGKQFIEKNPKATVSYLLDFDPLSNQLRWHVIYSGESSGKLTVLVDASSGRFVRKE